MLVRYIIAELANLNVSTIHYILVGEKKWMAVPDCIAPPANHLSIL